MFGIVGLVAKLPDSLKERLRLDIANGAADLNDDEPELFQLAAAAAQAAFDLVGDMGDDLDRGA